MDLKIRVLQAKWRVCLQQQTTICVPKQKRALLSKKLHQGCQNSFLHLKSAQKKSLWIISIFKTNKLLPKALLKKFLISPFLGKFLQQIRFIM